MDNKLSKYPSGSIREVLSIALPLMVAIFSFNIMIFVDRLILAQYSIEAMNAAGVIILVVILFQFLLVNVAAISEVIIGRHYGAKEYSNMGRPVWQMIWLSIFASIFMHFIGQYAYSIFVPEQFGEEGVKYFQVLLTGSALYPIVAALAAFFIARGKTAVVTISAVIANLINILLAYIFVFGVEGYLEPHGLVGSAYAMLLAEVVQIAILFFAFATPYNIKHFKVLDYKFDFKIMKESLRIGLPNAIGHFIEIACWSAINRYLADLSPGHITVSVIAGNFLLAFSFMIEALQKSTIAVVSNAIGSKETHVIKKTIASSLKIIVVIGVLSAFPLIFFSDQTINIFFANLEDERLMKYAAMALFGTWLFLVFDGIGWIFAAVLTSGGDTKFIMFAAGLTSWFFGGLPIFLFVNETTPEYMPWMVMLPIYTMVLSLSFYLRYRYGKWKQKIDA